MHGRQVGKNVGGSGERKGYSQHCLVPVRECHAGIFSDYVLQTARTINETAAATEMARRMVAGGRSLFLGDRGYGSLSLIETTRRKEDLDCLMRVKDSWISETAGLPFRELDVDIGFLVVTTQTNEGKEMIKRGEAKFVSGTSRDGKGKSQGNRGCPGGTRMEFRAVRLRLEGGAWETLATTLPREESGISDLKQLYFLGWKNIETAFRSLKRDSHMPQLHCRKKSSALQEIHAKIAIHNMVSCIMRIASCVKLLDKEIEGKVSAKTTGRPGGKRKMMINRHFASNAVADFLRNEGDVGHNVIHEIARTMSPVRDGRSFRREMRAIGLIPFIYR